MRHADRIRDFRRNNILGLILVDDAHTDQDGDVDLDHRTSHRAAALRERAAALRERAARTR